MVEDTLFYSCSGKTHSFSTQSAPNSYRKIVQEQNHYSDGFHRCQKYLQSFIDLQSDSKSQFKECEEELGSVADTYLDIPSGKWSVDFKGAFGRLINLSG